MKPILFFLLILTVSCGVKKKSSQDYGKTTSDELIKTEGEPIKKESIPIDNGVIFHYPDDVKYQIQNDVVEVGFKNPVGDEKSVLYWKHKFKDCKTITKELPSKSHMESEIEFSCPEEGQSVIYLKNSPTILRVIEYAKK